MIQFNTLKFLTKDVLQIDVSVISLDCYNEITIEKILIDTEETVQKNRTTDANAAYEYDFLSDLDHQLLNLDISQIPELGGNVPHMLFVYAKAKGIPSSDTPCGGSNTYSLKAIVKLQEVYNNAKKYLSCPKGNCACTDNCDIDMGLAEFALQYQRLEMALACDDYENALDAYCGLLRKPNTRTAPPSKQTCNCNGNH